jgi:2-polyprenyl-3-methyl-5-hydroxy-6-metoxy-1,4-benzoquinol methylase
MAMNSLPNESTDPKILEIPRDSPEAAPASPNLARDRVAQTYLGLTGNSDVQHRLRRRINWMAAQAAGSRVLDIGCSEGILELLLAREGFHVTGIDVNQDALQYAQDLLAQENEFVAPRVTFILGDMNTAELGAEPFDTVIVGEVLEHLTNPGLMLRRAAASLRAGGRLVVTTPFGHFPHPDHRQTFSTTGLVALLREICTPVNFSVADGYFQFVGMRSETPDWTGFDAEYLLRVTEREAIEQQKSLRGQLEILSATNTRLRQTNQKAETELKELRTVRLELAGRLTAAAAAEATLGLEVQYLKEAAEQAERGLDAILEELKARRGELERFEQRITQANAETQQVRAKLQLRQREVDTLKAQGAALEHQNTSLSGRLETTTQQAARATAEHAAAQQRLAQAEAEIETLRVREGQLAAELAAALQRTQARQDEVKTALLQVRETAHALRRAEVELSAEKLLNGRLQTQAERLPALQAELIEAREELELMQALQTEAEAAHENAREREAELRARTQRAREAAEQEGKAARQEQATQRREFEHAQQQYRDELEINLARIKKLTRSLKLSHGETAAGQAQQEALRKTLTQREETITRLSRELHRLRHEHELLLKSEYASRSRAAEAEQNTGYRIARRLRELWLATGRAFARKLAKRRRRKWDPVLTTLELTTPEGARAVRFSCARPEWVRCEGMRVAFDVPVGETAILISKENARFSEAPRKKQMRLERAEGYTLTGTARLEGTGEARLHLLEYQRDRFLQGGEVILGSGAVRRAWETHEEHRRLCVALELRGTGALELEELKIERGGEPQPEHALILRRNAEAGAQVRLTRRPRWRTIGVRGEETIALFGALRFEEATDAKAGFALVRIEFLNAAGERIDGPYAGVQFSRRVGHYRYLRVPGAAGERSELLRLTPPAGATAARLGFQTWNARRPVFIVNMVDIGHRAATGSVVQAPAGVVVAAEHEAAALVVQPVVSAAQRSREEEVARIKAECAIAGWADADPAPDPARPTVLGVMDEFTTTCFAPECNLIRPRPDNWEALAEFYKPQMLFIESAWQGNGRTWQYRVGKYSNSPGNELAAMTEYARRRGIPLVFWNKEDPVHHLKFMETAKLATTIFTTDACMIDSYREKTGCANVFALPFAAQPALHRPAPLPGRRPASCFAGSWYEGRHAERAEAMRYLLEAARPFGLDIYDRNHGTGIFPFPPQFAGHVRGSLPYDRLCAEYSRYRVFLNVNSVFESPTMFSRRVFELMACGTPVVSSYARGIEEILGTDAVWLVRNAAETEEAMRTLMTDEREWRRRSLAGIRRVFSAHTYAHRLAEVQRRAGLSETRPVEPRVLLLAEARTVDDLRRLAEFYPEQSWRNFELVVFTEFLESAGSILPAEVRAIKPPEARERWLAEELVRGGFVLFGSVDHQAYYGRHYLQDLVNAARYAPEADVLGKSLPGEAEFVADGPLAGAGCLVRAEAFRRAVPDCAEKLLYELPAGLRRFAADHEEFIAPTG